MRIILNILPLKSISPDFYAQVKITYHDNDGDEVDIDGDEVLQEALSLAAGDPPLLRVICVPLEEDYVFQVRLLNCITRQYGIALSITALICNAKIEIFYDTGSCSEKVTRCIYGNT